MGNSGNAGTIYASIGDGAGGWYVGGAFTCIGGDGSLDGDCSVSEAPICGMIWVIWSTFRADRVGCVRSTVLARLLQ